MAKMAVPDNMWSCDVCGCDLPRGTGGMDCRVCNWTCCKEHCVETLYIPQFNKQGERLFSHTSEPGHFKIDVQNGKGVAYRNSKKLDDLQMPLDNAGPPWLDKSSREFFGMDGWKSQWDVRGSLGQAERLRRRPRRKRLDRWQSPDLR